MERFVIEREVDGKPYLFALTEHEMNKVYDMVQHHQDKEDVIMWFENGWTDASLDNYDDDAIDEIAYRKRNIQEAYCMEWNNAVENAVLEYASEKKNGGTIL